MSLQQLREKRDEAYKAILRLRDAINVPGQERDFTAEERANWESANRDFDAANAAIDAVDRADVVERALNPDPDYRARPGEENSYPLGRRGAGRGTRDASDYDMAVEAMFRSASGLDLESCHYR